jgi:hypothetical protein
MEPVHSAITVKPPLCTTHHQLNSTSLLHERTRKKSKKEERCGWERKEKEAEKKKRKKRKRKEKKLQGEGRRKEARRPNLITAPAPRR